MPVCLFCFFEFTYQWIKRKSSLFSGGYPEVGKPHWQDYYRSSVMRFVIVLMIILLMVNPVSTDSITWKIIWHISICITG